jgi:hypothetical protein
MSRQEEVIQEFVLEQLDELGLSGGDCAISFIPARGRKRAQIVLSFDEESYAEVYEVLEPYLSELAEDYSYTFSGSVSYKLCVSGDEACVESESSDDIEEFLESSVLLDEYADVDDPDAQYEEEGLVITSEEDFDNDYYVADEDDENE